MMQDGWPVRQWIDCHLGKGFMSGKIVMKMIVGTC